MKIVLTPDWFINNDLLIEAFSCIILLALLFISIRNYKFDKNKKFLYVGVGFGLIGLAELASLFTKLVLFRDIFFTSQIGALIIQSRIVSDINFFYYLGFFFFRFLTLAGLYVIYKLPLEGRKKEEFFLPLFFVIVISILSQNMSYLFRLTALVLLILITKNYYLLYVKNKSNGTLIVLSSFSILALSNLLYLFAGSDMTYVIADLMELVSYITMLFLIIRILKYGKEKKSNGYNIGHTGNNPAKRREH